MLALAVAAPLVRPVRHTVHIDLLSEFRSF